MTDAPSEKTAAPAAENEAGVPTRASSAARAAGASSKKAQQEQQASSPQKVESSDKPIK